MILSLASIPLLNLTDNKYLLIFIEVFYFRRARLKVVIVSVQLQEMSCLLANNDLVRRCSNTNTACLFNCLTSKRELWLQLANDGGEYWPRMNTNTDLQICLVSQVNVFNGVEDIHGKICNPD